MTHQSSDSETGDSEARADGVRKVVDLMEDSGPIAMVATRASDGRIKSRPMTLQETEFDGDLWFFADRNSGQVEEIRLDPQVNVSFGSATAWVSLAGTASLSEDLSRKQELWNSAVEAWFPEGPESSDVVLLKVAGESAEYWESPGGRVATLLSFAKAKVTGDRPDTGENEKLAL
jgi:general stress protein 26